MALEGEGSASFDEVIGPGSVLTYKANNKADDCEVTVLCLEDHDAVDHKTPGSPTAKRCISNFAFCFYDREH